MQRFIEECVFQLTRNQETIDNYVTDLHFKAKSCEFEHLADGLIGAPYYFYTPGQPVRARLM